MNRGDSHLMCNICKATAQTTTVKIINNTTGKLISKQLLAYQGSLPLFSLDNDEPVKSMQNEKS